MLISDNSKLNTQISDGAVPSLLSNNKQVVKIATAYFETLWNKAEHTPVLLETKEEHTVQTENTIPIEQ